MEKYDLIVPVSVNNDAIVKIDEKCTTCGLCKKVCEDEVTVARMFEIKPDKEPICINCGQCAYVCPTESITEKFDYLKVKNILKNKNGKKVVFSIAPAVRVSLAEEFDMPAGTNIEGQIAYALRLLGADYVFDITFGADLTIMEEAMELVTRIKEGKTLPQFTSCCPAWIKYCEIFYPRLIPNLSTAKSPIAMYSTMLKTYFANKENIDPKDIINVVIAPCTAKKSEINKKELSYTEKDTDYILTTREFALLLKDENIDIKNLDESFFDSILGTGSGSGVIFGSSGGVCEAALRTAYYYLTGENLKEEDLIFNEIRGMNKIKETTIEIGEIKIKAAVCNGMKNAKELINKILKGETHYDFIEVMSCVGGCIAGGGQPKVPLKNANKIKRIRMGGLYEEDASMNLRLCHENPEIKEIYNSFLGSPNSEKAIKLLHTSYTDKSYMLED